MPDPNEHFALCKFYIKSLLFLTSLAKQKRANRFGRAIRPLKASPSWNTCSKGSRHPARAAPAARAG